MRVLRDNKESLMAVLEAFVYDPLINWKLQLQPSPTAPNDVIVDTSQQNMASVTDGLGILTKESPNYVEDRPQKRLFANESELIQRENTQPDAINELAIQVLNRVQSKLTGAISLITSNDRSRLQTNLRAECAHSSRQID
jgi:serine/threonine-protein kinase mTOR